MGLLQGGNEEHAAHFADLGTKNTFRIMWGLRIRELEEEGWTTAFTDGSGLDSKA